MPIVNVKLLDQGATNQQKEQLISKMTEVLTEVLNKKPETTHVIIEEIDPVNWGLAGKPLTPKKQDLR